MEEIKKLISNKNFAKEIKCNVILMLINTNKSQARDIIAMISEYKEIDNDFATHMIKKIVETKEYNEILEELNIEIENNSTTRDNETETNDKHNTDVISDYHELNEFKDLQHSKQEDKISKNERIKNNIVYNSNIMHDSSTIYSDNCNRNDNTIHNKNAIYNSNTYMSNNKCNQSNILHLIVSKPLYNLTQNIQTFFNHMKNSPILPFYLYKRNSVRTNHGSVSSYNTSFNSNKNTNYNKQNSSHINCNVNKMKIPIEFVFYKKSNKAAVNQRHLRKSDSLYTRNQNMYESNDNIINEYHAKRYKNTENESYNVQTQHANNNFGTQSYNTVPDNYNVINNHTTPNNYGNQNVYTTSNNYGNQNVYNTPNIYNTPNTYNTPNNYNLSAVPSSIYSIFTYKLQCTVCGLRFCENEEGKTKMVKHIEEHTRKTRNMESNKGKDNFIRYEDFNNTYVKIDLDLVVEEEKNVVIAENASCDICKSKIEKGWDDKIESWILLDCVVIDEERKKYCHRSCIM